MLMLKVGDAVKGGLMTFRRARKRNEARRMARALLLLVCTICMYFETR